MDTKNTEDEIFDHVLQYWGEQQTGQSLPGLGSTLPHHAVLDDIYVLKFVDTSTTPHQGALVPVDEDAAAAHLSQAVARRLQDHFDGHTIHAAVLAPPGVAVPSKAEFFAPGEPAPHTA